MCRALISLLIALSVAQGAVADRLAVRLGQQCPFIKTRTNADLRGDVKRVDHWFGQEWDEGRSLWIREFDAQIASYFFDENGVLRRIVAQGFTDSGLPESTFLSYGVWYDVEIEGGAVAVRRYQEYSMRQLKLYEMEWYWVSPGVFRVVVPYPPARYEVETRNGSIVLIRTYDREFRRSGSTTYYGEAGYPVRTESYENDGSIGSTTLYENGMKTEFSRGEHSYRYSYQDGRLVTERYEGGGIRRETTYEYVLDEKGNWTEKRTYVDEGGGRKALRRETRTIEYYGSD